MPSVHSIPRPLNVRLSSATQSTFAFPANEHLLITTSSRILSWDSAGLHELFASSKSGIAAATESKDGSGILAIADKHVVVLHDTKRGKEKSWGLSAQEDEVRHLEYTKDSKSLFLTTRDTNAIQCYSIQAQQLLSPPQTLASPAAALAVSPTGHLMISAHGTPPVVFVKDLAKNSTATLLKPQASTSGVSIVAFHPERVNVFLLAFDDGSLAVFDASRLTRTNGEGRYADQLQTNRAELGRKRELHRALHVRAEGRPRAITGAAFLPGRKLKVITVGIDGRCKLVDFSDGTNVLRTWHGQAPLTSVSVLGPWKDLSESGSQMSKRSTRTNNQGNIIAVGSQDGNVMLYDPLGLLQSHQEISAQGEKIISVEWINGPSPKAIANHTSKESNAQIQPNSISSPGPSVESKPTKKGTPRHLSVHPALRPPTTNPTASVPRQSGKFTIHPDEVADESTVRHTPISKGKQVVSAEAGEYLDLFSPVNPFATEQTRANRDSSFSPTRVRPRIDCNTFAQKTTPGRDLTLSSRTPKLSLTDSHATSSASVDTYISGKGNVQFRPSNSASRISPLNTQRRRYDPGAARKRDLRKIDKPEINDAKVAANAKLLRDLRQMSAKSRSAQGGSILQSYASEALKDTKRSSEQPQGAQNLVSSQAIPQQIRQPFETQVYGPGGRWPTDSVDEPSWTNEQQDDIWITSDEEQARSSRRTHRYERPAARQTSRSRMDSKGTISTIGTANQSNLTAPPKIAVNNAKFVTSTDDYTTARSHVCPDGAFSLASSDVKSIFPRTSSKSPRKVHKATYQSPRKSVKHRKTALQEIASNSALAPRPIDPWSKMQKAKGHPVASEEDPERAEDASDDRVDYVARSHPCEKACGDCAFNTNKVRMLEGEVAHMKGEILALRAMLRRNGIPTPAVPRR